MTSEMEGSHRPKIYCSALLPLPPIVRATTRSASPASQKTAGLARPRLAQYHSFEHAVELLQSSSNIIVLTGAGISTSLGIKDFRSENGLYNLLSNHGISEPQELFHIQTFMDDPATFYNVIRHLLPAKTTGCGPTHAFIKLLMDKGKLLTNYTQNIDGLEQKAQVDPNKVVQCHGSLATAKCMTCGHTSRAEKYLPVLLRPGRSEALTCWKCWGKNGNTPDWSKVPKRSSKKRKRAADDDDDNGKDLPQNFGILKPSIVFFGEAVEEKFWPRLDDDGSKVDLLIIVGTSLQVEPVKNIPQNIPSSVPQIFINKDRCRLEGVSPDIQLLGECDVIVEELARRAGWNLEHEMINPAANPVRVELIEGTPNRHLVRRTRPSSSDQVKPSSNGEEYTIS